MRECDMMGAKDLAITAVDDIPADPGSREDRVRTIMSLMADMRWENGVTAGLLADRWSLHVNTVSAMAGEASRRLKSVVSPEYVRTKICNSLDRIMVKAEDKQDFKAVAMISKVYGEVSGANAPRKHELTGADGAPLGLPPKAALLLEAAKRGDTRAKALLEEWVASGDEDAPALPSGDNAA